MTFCIDQIVEVRFPSESDLLARAWGWWPGVVTAVGHISGTELYHVRLDATGVSVPCRPEHLRAAPVLGGLFAEN